MAEESDEEFEGFEYDTTNPCSYNILELLDVATKKHSDKIYDESTREGMIVSLIMTTLNMWNHINRGDTFPCIVMYYQPNIAVLDLMYTHPRCVFKGEDITRQLLEDMISGSDMRDPEDIFLEFTKDDEIKGRTLDTDALFEEMLDWDCDVVMINKLRERIG
eukprot:gene3648-13725_t